MSYGILPWLYSNVFSELETDPIALTSKKSFHTDLGKPMNDQNIWINKVVISNAAEGWYSNVIKKNHRNNIKLTTFYCKILPQEYIIDPSNWIYIYVPVYAILYSINMSLNEQKSTVSK